jgi:protein KTI12
VGCSVDEAREVNEKRLKDGIEVQQNGTDGSSEDRVKVEENLPYERETWENLVFRYEEPNAMARWDSPLFTVLREDKEPPFEAIWNALIGAPNSKPIIRPNQATVARPQNTSDFLYELDKATQAILNEILQWTKDHPGETGGEVVVGKKEGGNGDLVVELPATVVGLPTLQRLRRQFIGLNRTNSVPVDRIQAGFVGFLNDAFESA